MVVIVVISPEISRMGTPCATLFNPTRYDKIVEGMGGHGEFVENPADIRPAIDRAFASGKPACVNVIIKRDMDFGGGIYM